MEGLQQHTAPLQEPRLKNDTPLFPDCLNCFSLLYRLKMFNLPVIILILDFGSHHNNWAMS